MEEIEKIAINETSVSPKFWKRYVDDSFCITKSDAVENFERESKSKNQREGKSRLNGLYVIVIFLCPFYFTPA